MILERSPGAQVLGVQTNPTAFPLRRALHDNLSIVKSARANWKFTSTKYYIDAPFQPHSTDGYTQAMIYGF